MKVAPGFKPTIATAQADTVLFANDIDGARETCNQGIVDDEQNGITASPKLIIFAENYSSPNHGCMVIYRNLEYKFKYISRGVDVFHKLSAVLKIPVSKVSKLVWIFIGHHLYGVCNNNAYKNIDKLHEFLTETAQCSSTVP